MVRVRSEPIPLDRRNLADEQRSPDKLRPVERACLREYEKRQEQVVILGKFGYTERGYGFQPQPEELRVCCMMVTAPALISHFRSLVHVANLYGLSPSEMNRVVHIHGEVRTRSYNRRTGRKSG